jgi:hypothetical protein
VIHDELIRHFESKKRPELSADFAASLRSRLRSLHRPSAADLAVRRWMPRLYWLAAAVLLAMYWPAVPFTFVQLAVLAVSAAIAARVWQRALHAPPLVRVLREALWR